MTHILFHKYKINVKSRQFDKTQMKNKEKHKYLKDTIVWNPTIGCIYHLRTSTIKSGEVLITFEGETIEEYAYIDLASGLARQKQHLHEDNTNIQLKLSGAVFVSNESLNSTNNARNLPPIRVFYEKLYPDNIIDVTTVHVTLEKDFIKFDSNCNLNDEIVYVGNTTLEHLHQKLINDIPVITGKYPIFLSKNRPDFFVVANIYKDFINYNKPGKLKEQYNSSKGLCHIRAHFASMLLNCYGIQTVKLFKFWNTEDWRKFPSAHGAWKFHCATMVIDKEGCGWVWDPFKCGMNKHLSTLQQWVYNTNEPKPKTILITNQAVIYDGIAGEKIDGTHFMKLHGGQYIDSFQAVASSALLNKPERPLRLWARNKFYFFNTCKLKSEDQLSDNPESKHRDSSRYT